MTRRERIIAALEGRKPDRVPRAYTAVPGFEMNFPGALAKIEARFPQDVADCGYRMPEGATHGDPYGVGEYVDEWGCVFTNVQAGIIGEVREPIIRAWSDLDKLKPPMHLLSGFDAVERTCAATDGFTLSALPIQPFERMQFLRGSETLFLDLAMQPAELFKMRDLVHEFNLAWAEAWCKTPIDCLFLADDWGTQQSLLISPNMWRELFKPMYAEYLDIAKKAGKYVYMHSDGEISAILDDLIEIGVTAINAQVTCMDFDKLRERFAGRITFWGQMDRQRMLCFGNTDDAKRDVQQFYDNLRGPGGGNIVAQMHIEPTAKPANIEAVLAEFDRLST
ncbi:MAG: methyltransferase [Phycisphaerales bacterium]|nr:methyltransferase [Phycisphaerales bacterium]